MSRIKLIKIKKKEWMVVKLSNKKFSKRFYDITKETIPTQTPIIFEEKRNSLLFEIEDSISWSAESKKQFTCIQKKINDYHIENPLYTIYAWSDSSSYTYWKQEFKDGSYNYAQITIEMHQKKFPASAIDTLDKDLQKSINYFESLENECY